MMNQQRRFQFSIPVAFRHAPVWVALAVLFAWVPAPAHAEGFFDLYFGAAFPQDDDVDIHSDDFLINTDPSFEAAYGCQEPPCPAGTPSRSFEWETSPSLGFRGGYWFEFDDFAPSFLGIGLDLSYYRAFEEDEFGSLDVWATPITPLLMLRIPLGYSEDYPGGRVQPYVAVGPGFTLTAARADLSELGIGLDDFEDATFDVGADARAGLAIPLGHSFALFGEYRYTYLEPHFEDTVDDALGGPDFEAEFDVEPELSTHHIVFGLSFRF